MKITYIDHSGFLVETEECLFLFDYVNGTLPDIPNNKPLYVFASHSHPDHFRRDLFKVCADVHPDTNSLTFLLGKDIFKRFVTPGLEDRAHFLASHEKYEDSLIKVNTLKSNDQGVAFIIEFRDKKIQSPQESVQGGSDTGDMSDAGDMSGTEEGLQKESLINRRIYFAGDLNAWNWDGDEEDMKLIRIYHEELQSIKGTYFDIAFIVLDPRLKDNAAQGITDFFKYCDAGVIVPMHCWGNYGIITQTRKSAIYGDFMSRILPIEKKRRHL